MIRGRDVCVVGGGIVGVATAYYAAKRGLSVVLLEQRELASGPSGAAFGGVSAHIYSYADVRVPAPYAKLSLASIELYRQLQEDVGPPLDFAPVGQIDPYFDDGDRASREERVRSLQAAGVPVELLSGDELREIEPALSEEVAGGTHCPVDGMVSPQCAVRAFADGARAYGADVRTGVAVTSVLVRHGRAVGVRTSSGDIAADNVVLAAGAATPALLDQLRVDLPLNFSKGQIFVTERRPRLLSTCLHHIKQTSAGTFVIGITREVFATSAQRIPSLGTSPGGFREVMRSAVRTIPSLAPVRILRSWAGEIVIPADGYPVLGRLEGVEGVSVGVGNRGIATGPALGEILAELAADGRTDEDISSFAPGRFDRGDRSPQELYYGGHLGVTDE